MEVAGVDLKQIIVIWYILTVFYNSIFMKCMVNVYVK